MRNPFPKIGKIIKYEFKHSARLLLPLYGVLLVLGLLTGLSVDGSHYRQIVDNAIENSSSGFEINIDESQPTGAIVTVLLGLAVTALTVAVIVITILTLSRRFKQSMLGDEAYLNLSLPATMGEQLWGRFIMNLAWILAASIVIFLTFILCFIRMDLPGIFEKIRSVLPELNEALESQSLNLVKIIALQFVVFVTMFSWVISLIFVSNAISHLMKNQKKFISILIVVGLIYVCGKVSNVLFPDFHFDSFQTFSAEWGKIFINSCWLYILENIIWTALFFGFTQFVFTKKLNLE